MNRLLPLTSAHAAKSAIVHAKCFEIGWDTSSITKLLALPGTFGWLSLTWLGLELTSFHKWDSMQEGVAVGLIMCRLLLNEAEVLTMGVLPEARRCGLGRRLLETACTIGSPMFLEVAVDNTGARAFYRKLGFKEVGRRTSYYQRSDGAVFDALILRT